MSAQIPLLPTLYALTSPPLQSLHSHLSKKSLHIEPYTIIDQIYTNPHPVVPNQHRNLRLRATKALEEGESGSEWTYELAYVSQPLSGREYSEMSVRAYLGVEVVGLVGKKGMEEFVQTLGFE